MGKAAVITGGTKGIGKAIIIKLASEGFDIITCARNEEDLTSLKKEIEHDYAVAVSVIRADLSVREDVNNFIEAVKDNTDKVDILVNNTGVFIPGEICTESEGHLEMMINTNLYSAYHLTRGLVGKMIEYKSGYIFNMCSVASLTAYPNGGSYCISKFAMYGMSKVLREELKEHNIRVTSIMPGATLTDSWHGVDIPAERFMKSEVCRCTLGGV